MDEIKYRVKIWQVDPSHYGWEAQAYNSNTGSVLADYSGEETSGPGADRAARIFTQAHMDMRRSEAAKQKAEWAEVSPI